MYSNIDILRDHIDKLSEVIKETAVEIIPANHVLGSTPSDFLKSFALISKDIKRLTSNEHLIVYFSKAEVDAITSNVANSISYFNNKQFSNAYGCLNVLRPMVRSYWIRNRSAAEIDRYTKCEEKLADLEEIISQKTILIQQLDEVSKKLESSNSLISTVSAKISEINIFEQQAKNTNETITLKLSEAEKSLAEINSKEELVKAFAEKIAQRETQIENQAALTKNYEDGLKKIAERKTQSDDDFANYVYEKKQQIREIIDDAAEALNLRNAQGLSREFKTKADSLKPGFGVSLQPFRIEKIIDNPTETSSNENEDSAPQTEKYLQFPIKFSGNGSNWWIFASGLFVFAAIGLSIWLLLGSVASTNDTPEAPHSNIWYHLVGRISMIGLLVTAAVFCAKQFTKASKLFEDYAYRKILIASLPGFLRQLESMEESDSLEAKYLTKVLDEINVHPIRGTEDNDHSDGLNLTTEQFSKITSLIKSTTK